MLQDIRNNDRLFGGPPVIIGGDFEQILPVIRQSTRATIVGACIQRSYIWPRLSLLFLWQNMRLLHDEVICFIFLVDDSIPSVFGLR